MNTVITIYDRADEWYQNTYICCGCEEEFMTYREKVPRFCPGCGVKFDALRIKYPVKRGGKMETIFLKEEEDDTARCSV